MEYQECFPQLFVRHTSFSWIQYSVTLLVSCVTSSKITNLLILLQSSELRLSNETSHEFMAVSPFGLCTPAARRRLATARNYQNTSEPPFDLPLHMSYMLNPCHSPNTYQTLLESLYLASLRNSLTILIRAILTPLFLHLRCTYDIHVETLQLLRNLFHIPVAMLIPFGNCIACSTHAHTLLLHLTDLPPCCFCP